MENSIKPALLKELDDGLYKAKLRGEQFDVFFASKEAIEEAKQWCRDLMGHHFAGDYSDFMWNGVKIKEE